ncbi:uncharacterized protein CTHT_0042210 [Thermochaetoides thermophila DSM 1495]|uniref:Uncharacterized protein n=1 Tax=Chaetomium thermophilum (strain DSM 1495 / CBS 144.50 / IMI 039719) TaxID=759272 RepID=G0SAG6_CHATD|nr:hypothetical protein CTHT_0042210 [Thermochaetoides thermophila DSM 1495]EGS19738.1 hypothetical protein CTHT_0042210 [Thermochaetoides thermophila DSM 1495]
MSEIRDTETSAYQELMQSGGRPMYPICLLDEVLKDPEGHLSFLLPWQAYPGTGIPDRNVFTKQLARWKAFRSWQKDCRGIRTDEKEFDAYVEDTKRRDPEWRGELNYEHQELMDQHLRRLQAEFEKTPEAKDSNDKGAAFREFVEKRRQRNLEVGCTWPGMTEAEYRQALSVQFNLDKYRRYQAHLGLLALARGKHGFPEYVAKARRRLSEFGLTQTFEFDEDPTRQDKLTTWIKYLYYELLWHDYHERSINRMQREYDEAWEKLVASRVLQSMETDETLRTTESILQRASERQHAEQALAAAEEAARKALLETAKAIHGGSSLSLQQRKQRLKTAYTGLLKAKKTLKIITRRNNLIAEFLQKTRGYSEAKYNLQRQQLLLQWILAQVPHVEEEVNAFNGNNTITSGLDHTHRKKRHPSTSIEDIGIFAHRSNEPWDERPAKRIRINNQGGALGNEDVQLRRSARIAARRSHCLEDKKQASICLRRSARLAAKRSLQRT